GHGSYMVASDTEVSSRLHLEGALDDLRLEAVRKEPALAIVTTFSQTLDADARAELLDIMKTILNPEQLTTLTTALEEERRLSVESTDQQGKIVRFVSFGTIERSVRPFRRES